MAKVMEKNRKIDHIHVGLSNDILMDIRQRVYLMLDELGPESFDYHHVRRVEAECAWLATRRELDLGVALAIGLLHDIGRVWWYVEGSRHAKEGSKAARIILNDYDVDPVTLDVICLAISRHSTKKKIHGPYDELIKDADCLAHELEGSIAESPFEMVRASYAKYDAMHLRINKSEIIENHLLKQYTSYGDLLADLYRKAKKDKKIKSKDIHLLRTRIRSIRSIYGLMKGSDDWKQFSQSFKKFQKLFKRLEYSRKLGVLEKSLVKIGVSKSLSKCIQDLLKKENQKIGNYVAKHYEDLMISVDVSEFKIRDIHHMEAALTNLIHDFRDRLDQTDMKDIVSLHELRIQTKWIKYLMDEKIIQGFSDLDLGLMNDLHTAIGRLHDIDDNRKLLEKLEVSKDLKISKKDKAAIESIFIQRIKSQKKDLTLDLLKMNKRFSTFTSHSQALKS